MYEKCDVNNETASNHEYERNSTKTILDDICDFKILFLCVVSNISLLC